MVSPSYKVFSVNKRFNPHYISLVLKSHRALYEYINVSEQGASVVRRNLNMDLFYNISFSIPTLQRQEYLSRVIGTLQYKLEHEKQLSNLYLRQKRALLQQMFI